jgi:hypothetical protein
MKFLTDGTARLFGLDWQAFLGAGIVLENRRQNQIFWPGE